MRAGRIPSVSALFALLFTLFILPVYAADKQAAPNAPGEGALVRADGTPLPLKKTDVKISVTGFIASVDVEQIFTNPDKEKIEAVYIFPLPSESAVDDMEIKIGDRTIKSVLKEREEARRDYEQARDAGQRAGLLEQERPNIFTVSVANIEPGAEIAVRIHYAERLDYDDGGFRLVFPMVVAPRYMPGNPIAKKGAGDAIDADRVPDASRISPPLLPPNTRPGTNISVTVDLNSGIPVKKIRSLSHEIKTDKLSPSHYSVVLARLDEMPNKDFVLEYKIAGEQPEAAVMQALGTQGQGYFLIMAAPPSDFRTKDLRAKEMIFIIDKSGSMAGLKMEQAKNALKICLHGLNPQDSFNIIAFSSGFVPMSANPLPFTQENIDAADRFVDKIAAAGGTEMLPALLHALKQPEQPDRLRMIVFLTDGQIGNESELLQSVKKNLGKNRIFTFGIDSAVNERFLKKLAQIGRGTAEFLLPHQEKIESLINRFQSRISAPMLTDLSIDWAGFDVQDSYPNPLPDLYANQPVFVVGKFRPGAKRQIRLQALSAIGVASLPINVEANRSNSELRALAALYARSRIEQLSDMLLDAPADPTLKDEIVRLSIENKVLSSFTSFVALEEQFIVPADGGKPKKVLVPVALPDSWEDPRQPNRQEGAANAGAGNALQKFRPSGIAARAQAPAPLTGSGSGTVARADSPRPKLDAEPKSKNESRRMIADADKRSSKKPAESASNGAGNNKDLILADDRWRVGSPEPSKESVLAKAGEKDSSDPAHYLARKQSVKGAWFDERSNQAETLRSTALAALSFIADGNTTRKGGYQPQMRHAIEYIISNIGANGLLKGASGDARQTEAQAIALWATVEIAAGSSSASERKAVEQLIKGLLKLRGNNGTWLSREGGDQSKTATVWAALALLGAKKAGFAVEADIFETVKKALGAGDKEKLEDVLVKALEEEIGKHSSDSTKPVASSAAHYLSLSLRNNSLKALQ